MSSSSSSSSSLPSTLRIQTEIGNIDLIFRRDAAPLTVEHVAEAVRLGLYTDTCFYRSDFVVQCGLHGTGREHPRGDLPVNETHHDRTTFVSNTRGTASIAHHDVPDNGSTEIFINLKTNSHLDTAYGGYCVFAQIRDAPSFDVMDAISKMTKPKIIQMTVF